MSHGPLSSSVCGGFARPIFPTLFLALFLGLGFLSPPAVYSQGSPIEFSERETFPVLNRVNASLLEDVNGDGHADILSLVGEPGVDSVMYTQLGDGNGNFATAFSQPLTVGFPWSVAVGDFNEDGNADAIVSDLLNSTFTYLSGNGDGTFTPDLRLIPGWSGGNPQVLARDIDEDGHLDLVGANFFGSQLLVAWGTGIDDPFDAFEPVTAIAVSGFPMSIDVADLDLDGDLDLCCGFNGGSGGGVAVSLATGVRTFAAEVREIGGMPGAHWSTKAIDLDGGGPEIVTVGEGDGLLGIFPLVGGEPQAPLTLPISPDGRHFDAADLDLDGELDLVVRDTANGEYEVLRGLGGFTFQSELFITDDPVSFCPVFLQDLDSDGRSDLFSANYTEQTSTLHRNVTLTGTPFRRGDVNLDGSTNVADAIFHLAYLFSGGVDPGCADSADIHDDGGVNISDAITLLESLFGGGAPLPPPTGNCDVDPTADSLECNNTGGTCP